MIAETLGGMIVGTLVVGTTRAGVCGGDELLFGDDSSDEFTDTSVGGVDGGL